MDVYYIYHYNYSTIIMMYRWVMVGHVIRAIRLATVWRCHPGAIRLAADALGEVAATHQVRLRHAETRKGAVVSQR